MNSSKIEVDIVSDTGIVIMLVLLMITKMMIILLLVLLLLLLTTNESNNCNNYNNNNVLIIKIKTIKMKCSIQRLYTCNSIQFYYFDCNDDDQTKSVNFESQIFEF